MLSDNDALATVAVKNLDTAKKFYHGTLGLTKVRENDEVLAFKAVPRHSLRDARRSRERIARRPSRSSVEMSTILCRR